MSHSREITYKQVIDYNEEMLDLFKLDSKEESTITLLEPSYTFPLKKLGHPKDAIPVKYEKKRITSYEEKSNFLFKNGSEGNVSILNRNSSYETTLWTTSAKKIKQALRFGLFNSEELESPIAQQIACYGRYKKIISKRRIENEMIGHQENKKIAIVNFAQDAMEEFQVIYECVNNSDESKETILKKLNNLKIKLISLKEKYFEQNEVDAILKKGLDRIIRNISEFNIKFNNISLKNILKPTGTFCLNHFMQDQIEIINETARKANNNMSGLYNRGELFSCIVDAEIAHRKMNENPDYHNPASKELNFDFGAVKENKLITIDLKKYGAKVETDQELALQLVLLHHIQDYEDPPIPDRIREPKRFLGMNWHAWHGKTVPYTIARFFFNLFDFCLLPVWAVADWYPSEWLEKKLSANNPVNKIYKETIAKKIFNEDFVSSFPYKSVMRKFSSFVEVQFKKLLVEPFVQIAVSLVDLVKVGVTIVNDLTIGRTKITEAEIEKILDKKIDLLENQEKQIKKYQADFNNEKEKNQEEKIQFPKKTDFYLPPKTILAQLPYSMNFDEPNDALSGSADGMQVALSVFIDEIYNKRPASAMAFTAVAALGGLPSVIAALPTKIGFIKLYMDTISLPIAHALVGHAEGLTAGFSLSLIEGKIAFIVSDLLKNGPNSVFAHFSKSLLENPVIAAIVIGASVGVGYAIAYKLDLPWLSGAIKNEATGSFPWVELGFTGAKLAALIAEGLVDLSKDKEHLVDLIPNEEKEEKNPDRKLVIREKINLIDSQTLSATEKYKIHHWSEQTYGKSDPGYVRSVYGSLYKEKKIGPLAKSISIAFSYLMAFPRMLVSGVMYVVDRYIDGKSEELARLTLKGWNDFWGRKVPGDLGLMLRFFQKILKYTFLTLGVTALSVTTLVVGSGGLGLGITEFALRLTWLILNKIISEDMSSFSVKPHASFYLFKGIINTAKLIGKFLFQAKFFTRMMEAVVGWFRSKATHQNLTVANQRVAKIEISPRVSSTSQILCTLPEIKNSGNKITEKENSENEIKQEREVSQSKDDFDAFIPPAALHFFASPIEDSYNIYTRQSPLPLQERVPEEQVRGVV